jgi:hypothetical protein
MFFVLHISYPTSFRNSCFFDSISLLHGMHCQSLINDRYVLDLITFRSYFLYRVSLEQLTYFSFNNIFHGFHKTRDPSHPLIFPKFLSHQICIVDFHAKMHRNVHNRADISGSKVMETTKQNASSKLFHSLNHCYKKKFIAQIKKRLEVGRFVEIQGFIVSKYTHSKKNTYNSKQTHNMFSEIIAQ